MSQRVRALNCQLYFLVNCHYIVGKGLSAYCPPEIHS
jgi:hypothetical protein